MKCSNLMAMAFCWSLALAAMGNDQGPTPAQPDLSKFGVDELRAIASQLYRRVAQLEAEARDRASTEAQLRADLTAANTQRDAALAALEKLREAVDASPALKERLAEEDRIRGAVSEGRVLKGMTLDQAESAVTVAARTAGAKLLPGRKLLQETERSGDGGSRYRARWIVVPSPKSNGSEDVYDIQVDVLDGRVVLAEQWMVTRERGSGVTGPHPLTSTLDR